MSAALTPRQGLVAFMATLAGPDPSGFIELRHRRRGARDAPALLRRPPAQRAPPPRPPCWPRPATSTSAAPPAGCGRATSRRSRRAGCCGSTATTRRPSQALERFEPQPAVVVRTSARGLHAYWPLQQPLAAGELERANRRLAHALGACQSAVTNAAAVLRPPATLNWKYDPPAAVTLERYTGERLTADQVAGQLADPPTRPPRRAIAKPSPARAADPLLAIEPAIYVEALTGRARRPRRQGHLPLPPRPAGLAARLPRAGPGVGLL